MAPASATTVRNSSLLSELAEQEQQRRVNKGGRQSQAFRMQRTERFRRNLAKNQQHERQQRGAECHKKLAAQAQGNESHQHRRRDIDQRAQQQDQTDQPIGARQQRLGQARRAASFGGAMAQAIAVDAHQRGFAAGEKCGENE